MAWEEPLKFLKSFFHVSMIKPYSIGAAMPTLMQYNIELSFK